MAPRRIRPTTGWTPLGAALLAGNGYALWMDRTGRKPKGEEGELRRPRAWFLFAVGFVMAWWGLGSLLTN